MKKAFILFIPFIIHAQVAWIYRYTSPGTANDVATSIAYDNNGIIYVGGQTTYSGSSYMTVISLTSAGDTNWTYRLVPGTLKKITTDNLGEIYVCGYNWTFYVASLHPGGDTNWTYSNQASGESGAWDLVCDLDGNVYAAGWLNWGGLSEWDYAVISLSHFGNERWVSSINGGDNAYDGASAICYGSDSNVYSSGCMQWDMTAPYSFVVTSHNRFGGVRWQEWFGLGSANSIVYGADSNIYAAGEYDNNTDPTNFMVQKVSSSGGHLWSRYYDGSSHMNDYANSIVYSSDGNIYVAGCSDNTGTGNDFTVLSYTQEGDLNWAYQYQDSASSEASSIICGSDGKIYAGGYITGSNNKDCFIVCLSSSGDTEWVYSYNGPGNGDDGINQLIDGPDHRLYAVGHSTGVGTGKDFTVFCINMLAIEEDKNQSIKSPAPFEILPNPCCRSIKFDLNSNMIKHRSSLYLYDLSGRLVNTIWQNRMVQTQSIMYHFPADINAGIFFLILEMDGETYLQKLTILH